MIGIRWTRTSAGSAAAAGDGADEHTGEHIAALRNDHKRRRCAEGRKADRIRYVQNTADVIFAQRLMPRIKLVGRKRATMATMTVVI